MRNPTKIALAVALTLATAAAPASARVGVEAERDGDQYDTAGWLGRKVHWIGDGRSKVRVDLSFGEIEIQLR